MPFSEVQICNMALARIGHTIPIDPGDGLIASASSTTDNIQKAVVQCQLWYELVRDTIGRDFAYGTTTKYDLLVLASDGDGEVWEDVWENAWAYPSDCLWLRGFVLPASGYNIWPQISTESMLYGPLAGATWIIGTHGGAKVIFASGVDDTTPLVEYTQKQATAADNDIDVGNAHAWRLAAELCLPLLGPEAGTRMRDWCEKNYAVAIDVAKRAAANEQAPHERGDGRWMLSRGG